MKHLIIILMSCLAFKMSAQTAGDLDTSFGNGGKVTSSITNTNDRIFAMAIQPDGKIVAGGYANGFTNSSFCMVRYFSNGDVDTTFGNNGAVLTDIGGGYDIIWDMEIQPDGKIVVVGETFNGNDADIAVARYNDNGFLDNSFGVNGIKTIMITNNNDVAYDLKIDTISKCIYVIGHNFFSSFLIKFNELGQLDLTLNGTGIKNISFGPNTILNSFAFQSNSDIICAGSLPIGAYSKYMLSRFDTTGALDSSFGNNGYVTTTISSNSDEIQSIIVLPDDKVIAGGFANLAGAFQEDFALVKYQQNGVVDSSFGINGIVSTNINNDDILHKLALQTDGKIVAAGWTGSSFNFVLVRYNTNGTIDNSFGNNGIVTTDFGLNDDRAYSLAIQSDYKIVLAGETRTGNFNYSFALARYFSGLNVGIVYFEKQPLPVQAYPNPVTNYATLTYTLPKDESITIKLFDIAGKEIKTFMQGDKKMKGEQTEYLFFDESIKAGVYFLSIGNGEGVQSVKVVKN